MVKKITFIARAVLLMLLLVVPSYLLAEEVKPVKPWVETTVDGTILTFHYDDQYDKAVYSYWDLPEKGWPEWSNVLSNLIKKVIILPEFAAARPTYCGYWFELNALESIEGLEYLNTSEVTDMKEMFKGFNLKSLDLSHFDTSKVTDMSNMFAGTSLTSLDLTSFDTKSVTTTAGMFDGSSNLNYILVSNKFNLDNVTTENSKNMFYNCTSLPGYKKDDKVWDKTQASALFTNMDQAEKKPWVLYNASDNSLTFRYDAWKPYVTADAKYDVPTSGKPEWLTDTTGSEDNSETGAARIKKVIISSGFQYAEVPSTAYWFCGMSNLTTIEGMDSINTSKATDVTEMFAGCTSLTSLDINGNFLLANVKSMRGMFDGCTGLTSLNINGFLESAKVEDMSNMFRNCSQLTSLQLEKLVTMKATSMAEMFAGCQSLKEVGLNYFTTATVTNMESMFRDCKSLTFLDLSKFDNSQVMSVKDMFNGCASLDSIHVSDKFLPVSTCDATDMFKGCVKLPNYDASVVGKEKALDVKQKGYLNIVEAAALPWVEYADGKLTFHNDNQKYYTTSEIACVLPGNTTPDWIGKAADVKKVEFNQEFASVYPEYCVSWFSGMKQIASIEGLDYLNTSSVVSMQGMFNNCENLTSLDLSKFNTEKVTNMQGMFNGCSGLKNIFVTNSFSTDNVENSKIMFAGCVKLKNYNNSDAHDKDQACDTSLGGYLNNWDVIPVITWVEYQDADSTLTFHHDKWNGIIEDTKTYYLPVAGDDDALTPDWSELAGKIKKVTFLEEFQGARPTTCYKWFENMEKLTAIEGMTNLNTDNVTNMAYMFNNCNNRQLKVLDLTSFNTAKVTDMTYMFYNCNGLKEIVASDAFVTTNVAASDSLFYGCANLKKYSYSNKDNYYGICRAKYILDGGYFSQPVPFVWAYYNSAAQTATFYYDRTGDWNNAYLYYPKVSWVGDCEKATKAVIDESFANYKTKDMSYLLSGLFCAKELTGMENLNTEGVTNMSHMFDNGGFTYLDLTHFDTREVTDMSNMFSDCSVMQNIYVSKNFTVDKVTQSTDMFSHCKKLLNYYDGSYTQDKEHASYTDFYGYFTLRQHFIVGGKMYDIDQKPRESHPYCYQNVSIINRYAMDNYQSDAEFQLADDHTASYIRSLFEKWGTLCLPFTFNVEDNATCYFYTIDHIDNDNVIVKEVTTGNIEAGTPIIFARGSMTQEYMYLTSVKGSKFVVAPKDSLLTGTFDTTYLADGESYYLSDEGKFCKVADAGESVKLNPFCAYITPGEEGAQYASTLNIKVDDGTGIDNVIDTLNNVDGKTEIYDLNGRRLEQPQKGVNIVKNGSRTIKVTVK